MPVFQSGKGLAPAWCELQQFDIVELDVGRTHAFERAGKKEKLIVGAGHVRLSVAGQEVDAAEGANLDLAQPDGRFEVVDVLARTTLIRMCGRWGDEVGGSGIFTAQETAEPEERGDPVDYLKRTSFDNHFHDCDEYWIIFQGRGVAVSEGNRFEVAPGDCVATGMGHHHDMPEVAEPVRAVYFETTMEGQKRHGHLWEHTHGPARPKPERV
jgi:mannose-6-phosphate isomerase-like protein (cupin superfamily)